jgi:uncharacterized membrane protein (DUF106 family)
MLGLDPFFDFVFSPLLGLAPGFAILIVSIIISLIIVFATKLFTNQTEMKALKDEMKNYQKEAKQNKDDPKKVMEIQKKSMKVNMQYMKKSFKVTFITILPILLVFGWLNSHFTYEPLAPGKEFVVSVVGEKGVEGNVTIEPGDLSVIRGSNKPFVDNIAVFTLKGEEGQHLLTLTSGGHSVDKKVLITKERAYEEVQEDYKDDVFKSVQLGNNPLKVWGLSWFWIYLIFAIAGSSLLRKVFKIY